MASGVTQLPAFAGWFAEPSRQILEAGNPHLQPQALPTMSPSCLPPTSSPPSWMACCLAAVAMGMSAGPSWPGTVWQVAECPLKGGIVGTHPSELHPTSLFHEVFPLPSSKGSKDM